jgi:hypothetical protein
MDPVSILGRIHRANLNEHPGSNPGTSTILSL